MIRYIRKLCFTAVLLYGLAAPTLSAREWLGTLTDHTGTWDVVSYWNPAPPVAVYSELIIEVEQGVCDYRPIFFTDYWEVVTFDLIVSAKAGETNAVIRQEAFPWGGDNFGMGPTRFWAFDTVIGLYSNGLYELSGGTFEAERLRLGVNNQANGIFKLSNAGQLVIGDNQTNAPTGEFIIGEYGDGTLLQTGGTLVSTNHPNDQIHVGYSGTALSGGRGLWSMSGGTAEVANVNIGFYGPGDITLTGGRMWVHDSMVLGVNNNKAYGSLVLGGSGFLQVNNILAIGNDGGGAVYQSGGRLNVSNAIAVGSAASPTGGLFRLSNGTVSTEVFTVSSNGEYQHQRGTNLNGALYCYKDATLSRDLLSTRNTAYIRNYTNGLFSHTGGTYQVGLDLNMDGNYTLNGSGYIEVDRNLVVGDEEKGYLNHIGGNTLVRGKLIVGNDAGSDGQVYYDGGSLAAYTMDIGNNGKGHLTQWGSFALLTNGVHLGMEIRSTGSYLLASGGNLFADHLDVGQVGDGSFSQVDSLLSINDTINIGTGVYSKGVFFLNGAGKVTTDNLNVGKNGDALFDQLNGTVTVNNAFSSEDLYGLGSHGNLRGGDLNSGSAAIGLTGPGLFIQSGGVHRTDSLALGQTITAHGQYLLSTGRLESSGGLTLGLGGYGTLTQKQGRVESSTLTLGALAGSLGKYDLEDGSSTVTGDVFLAKSGDAYLNHTGGSFAAGGTIYLGQLAPGFGTLTFSDGDFSASNMIVGLAGQGLVRHIGTGTVTLSDSLTLAQSAGSTGTYELGSGVLQADQILNVSGTVTHTDGRIAASIISNRSEWTQMGGSLEADTLHILPGAKQSLSDGRILLHDDFLAFAAPPSDWPTFTQSGGEFTTPTFDTDGTPSNFLWFGGFLRITNDSLTADTTTDLGPSPSIRTGMHLLVSDTIQITASDQLELQPGGSITTAVLQADFSGTMIQSGGTLAVTDYVVDGTARQNGGEAQADGSLSVNSSGRFYLQRDASLLVSSNLLLAPDGSVADFYHQDDAGNTVLGHLYHGHHSFADTYYLLDSNGVLSAQDETLGYFGEGWMRQRGGRHMVADELRIAHFSGAVGRYDLQQGLLQASNLTVGYQGGADFNHSGGTNIVPGLLTVGYLSSAPTYDLTGGLLSNRLAEIGRFSGGQFRHYSGHHYSMAVHVGSGGSYTLSGGTGFMNQVRNSGNFSIDGGDLRSSWITNQGSFTFSSGSLTGAIDNSGTFTFTNQSPVSLAQSFTNSGTVHVYSDAIQFGFAGLHNNGGLYLHGTTCAVDMTTIHPSGFIDADPGRTLIAAANFYNRSTNASAWNTTSASLVFPAGMIHEWAVPGMDVGAVHGGGNNNFGWGSITIGETFLVLPQDGNTGNGSTAVYTDSMIFNGGTNDISGLTCAFHIYYNATNPLNAYLQGKTYDFGGGGQLRPIGPSTLPDASYAMSGLTNGLFNLQITNVLFGTSNTLQQTEDLFTGNWVTIDGMLPSSNSSTFATDPATSSYKGFFRILTQ